MKSYLLLCFAICCAIALESCSSSVSITATRLLGIVVDTTMVVEVGSVTGSESGKFREELVDEISSTESLSTPEDAASGNWKPFASLVVEGTYTPSFEEHSSEEQINGETQKMKTKVYSARFDYRITAKESGDLVVDGTIGESKSEKEKDESKGFLESIVGSIAEAVVKSIFSVDDYRSLREDIIRRFIGEISPHELVMIVNLFDDSDMPELKEGIGKARTGQWKEALGIFLDAVEKHKGHKNIHKAYYDAGVAYEYDHQYYLARDFLTKAAEMSDEGEYMAELARCRRYEQEYRWREGYLEQLKMMRK